MIQILCLGATLLVTVAYLGWVFWPLTGLVIYAKHQYSTSVRLTVLALLGLGWMFVVLAAAIDSCVGLIFIFRRTISSDTVAHLCGRPGQTGHGFSGICETIMLALCQRLGVAIEPTDGQLSSQSAPCADSDEASS